MIEKNLLLSQYLMSLKVNETFSQSLLSVFLFNLRAVQIVFFLTDINELNCTVL